MNPETLQFLNEETGLPIQVMDVDSSTNKFLGIRATDLIVYDTNSKHKVYYRAKNRVIATGATFKHTLQTNKHALLEIINS